MLDIFYERRFCGLDLSENAIMTLENFFKNNYTWKTPKVKKYEGHWDWDYKCIFYDGAINLFLAVDLNCVVRSYFVTTDNEGTFPLKVLRDFDRNRKKN